MKADAATPLEKYARAEKRRKNLFDLLESYLEEPDPANKYSTLSLAAARRLLADDLNFITRALGLKEQI
jgi:hypothetical protein